MEYWEFLLQKEGDQAWLPLESSQVEILEGRYRIMAHTSQPYCPVSVRISHRLAETPTKRRLMKRSDQTNEMGLMVVMPFTWLKPGLWEVHCAAAAANDEAQQYAIQLQVVSQDTDDLDEWFPEDWPGDRAHPGDLAAFPELTGNAPTGVPEAALQAAFAAIDQALAEAVLSGEEQSPQGLGLSTTHRIELAQSALMVNQGQMLMVVGKVEAAAGEGQPDLPLHPGASILALRLLDPQSATVLVLRQHDLAAQPLPATFVMPVELPAALSTRLLLGELILLDTAQARPQVKAIQRFTVTVDLAALFDAIANQAEAEPALGIVFAADGSSSEESLKNIAGLDLEPAAPVNTDLPVPPPRSMPTLLLPTSGLALPPKLYYPTPGAAATPTLPSISSAKPRSDAAQTKAAEPPGRRPAGSASDSLSLKLPEFGRPRPTPAPAAPAPAAPAPTPVPPPPPSPVDREFRTLNLQERFWSRLNALAVEAYESAASRQAEMAAASAAAQPPAVDPEAWRESAFAGEVVIYEEPMASEPEPEPVLSPVAEAQVALSPPAPQLELPEGELISGDRVSITLRVPLHPNRLYLKVWITDPQTRTLADEPRQLSQLTPDGRGNLEGTLSLTVPMGCLEAWFEAIAIDLVTQQESYKTSVSRAVMPPELGAMPPDELSF